MMTSLRRRISDPAVIGIVAVLRLLPDVSRGMTLLLVLGVVAATALPLAFTVVTGSLIGAVPPAIASGIDSQAGRDLLTLLLVAAGLIVGHRALAPLLVALGLVFGRHVDRRMRERLIVAVGAPAGVAHLEDPAVLDLLKSAQGVGTQSDRPGDAVASLASLLPDWLLALGSAVILMGFHWWLGLAWFLVWPVILFFLQREYVRVGRVAGGEARAVRRADYERSLALAPAVAKDVRIAGLTGWLADRFEASWIGAMGPIWRARKPGRRVLWATTAAVAVFSVVTYGLLARAAIQGEIGLAALALFISATVSATSFRAFDDANMTLAYAAVSVPSLLQLEERVGGGVSPRSAELPPGSPRTGVTFRGVRFRYAGGAGDTITDLDLDLPAGRSLAIVGANGAGKTTLVKLLCGLYEPTAGRITVDGLDLADVRPETWRASIAAIFQDFTRYHLSAADNVTLGAPEDAGQLSDAAERAGATEVVERLPGGWETVLSRQYADGADLSGGQWQRIALARALYAVGTGARLLILDEPTANLDVRAEAELYDRFLELTAGLTTVVISHRFSTVRRADAIVVLEDGRIVERGNHDELMAGGGRYAQMFLLQAARFTSDGDRADDADLDRAVTAAPGFAR